MTAYNLSPVSDNAQAIANALVSTCTQAGATCTWFDEARAIFVLDTGDQEFFVQVLESPPVLDVDAERWEAKIIDLEQLEAEQLAAYPEEE